MFLCIDNERDREKKTVFQTVLHTFSNHVEHFEFFFFFLELFTELSGNLNRLKGWNILNTFFFSWFISYREFIKLISLIGKELPYRILCLHSYCLLILWDMWMSVGWLVLRCRESHMYLVWKRYQFSKAMAFGTYQSVLCLKFLNYSTSDIHLNAESVFCKLGNSSAVRTVSDGTFQQTLSAIE